jgi:aspartate/methionine/tyrosine aminotransferase
LTRGIPCEIIRLPLDKGEGVLTGKESAVSLLLKKILIHSGLARLIPAARRMSRGGEAYLHYYSDRLLAAPYADVQRVGGLLRLHEPDGIDLACGTPRFELAPTAATRLPADRRGYPPAWGLPELRSVVADRLWTEHQVRARAADEVLITAGAAGGLAHALDTLVNPGHPVVLFDPCSPLYPLALRQRRARLRWVATGVDNGRLRFRLDELARALRRARLIILCHPNNPTGAVFAPEDMEQICWWAHKNDTLIFHDTSFAAWQFEGERCKPAASPYGERRTLTLGSVSQSHALAAARVGWLAGPRHLIGACALTAALHTPFVPTLCQQQALLALQLDPALLEPIRADLRARRQYGADRLRAAGLEPVCSAGTFFLWAPVGHYGLTGRQCAEQLRQEQKVLVWPGDLFGPSGRNFIRLACAGDEGRLREGLSRLAEFVRRRQRPAGAPTQRVPADQGETVVAV